MGRVVVLAVDGAVYCISEATPDGGRVHDVSWVREGIAEAAMRCPYCGADHDRVIDSRSSGDGAVIRRRRACLDCERRFTTYERIEEAALRVVKKDGSRVPFDRGKMLAGLLKACEKRPVATDQLEEVGRRIESHLHEMFDREVSSEAIGQLVMAELKTLDPVAYVRFASVYREFRDVDQFLDELRPLIKRAGKEHDEGPGD